MHRRRVARLQRDRVPEAGEGQAPQRRDADEHQDPERPGLEAHAEDEAERQDRHVQDAHATVMSATMWPMQDRSCGAPA